MKTTSDVESPLDRRDKAEYHSEVIKSMTRPCRIFKVITNRKERQITGTINATFVL
jgi:hypothetical protein